MEHLCARQEERGGDGGGDLRNHVVGAVVHRVTASWWLGKDRKRDGLTIHRRCSEVSAPFHQVAMEGRERQHDRHMISQPPTRLATSVPDQSFANCRTVARFAATVTTGTRTPP